MNPCCTINLTCTADLNPVFFNYYFLFSKSQNVSISLCPNVPLSFCPCVPLSHYPFILFLQFFDYFSQKFITFHDTKTSLQIIYFKYITISEEPNVTNDLPQNNDFSTDTKNTIITTSLIFFLNISLKIYIIA